MRSSTLKAAALAIIIAQATLANPAELAPLNPMLLPVGTHPDQDSKLAFDVFYFEAFPCSFGYTDHDAIPSNNCKGFALTVTHDHPDAEPTILWIQSPVMRSILGR